MLVSRLASTLWGVEACNLWSCHIVKADPLSQRTHLGGIRRTRRLNWIGTLLRRYQRAIKARSVVHFGCAAYAGRKLQGRASLERGPSQHLIDFLELLAAVDPTQLRHLGAELHPW